jgi:hypothetical protein
MRSAGTEIPGMRLAPIVLLMASLGAAGAAERRFDVTFTEDGKAQDADILVLADGKLALPGLGQRYAFAPAACKAKPGKGGAVTFTATLTSAQHGSLAVAGTVTGHTVTGTRTWSKPGKPPIVHQFTGDERDAEAKK